MDVGTVGGELGRILIVRVFSVRREKTTKAITILRKAVAIVVKDILRWHSGRTKRICQLYTEQVAKTKDALSIFW